MAISDIEKILPRLKVLCRSLPEDKNKLVKIDGEYVKLYVTTNKTLPKLLKNTGSLIVYHDGVLSNTNDNTPINYLYLGNNLISSGWGLHKEVQRNDTEYFFNYKSKTL